MDWSILKRRLTAYDAGGRALGDELTRKMAALAVDLNESTVYKLNGQRDIDVWMTRLMHSINDLHTLVALTPMRDRTFMYENESYDILDVVKKMCDKIDDMYARRKTFGRGDWAEFHDRTEPALVRSRTPEAADRRAGASRSRTPGTDHTHAGLTALLGRLGVGAPAADTRRWVCVDFKGVREIVCERPTECHRDVVDFLREVCLNYHMHLQRCTVNLNGHPYEMSSRKTIGDLEDAVGSRDPTFVLYN